MINPKVAIIDYGIGNLFSVLKACDFVGMNAQVTNNKDEILSSDAIILPGVGAFSNAMDNLHDLDLCNPIIDFANTGKPLMGVCLGMQLLLNESEELGVRKGLGIIEGVCKKFPKKNGSFNLKVPQINWNTIHPNQDNLKFKKNTPLENIKNGENMYFVHSYFAKLSKEDEVLSRTTYGGIDYCSSLNKKNIFGFQFHPEKSGLEGIKIYKEFNKIVKNLTNNK
jgi:glutamine amidotransferase